MQPIAQGIKQRECLLGFGLELVHKAEDLRDFRRPALDSDHGRQPAQPLLPDGIASNARIAGQHDEEAPRSIGQRAEDRRLHPEIGGVAQEERRQDLGAVGSAKSPQP